VLVLLMSKADTKEAAGAGGFDPPLVRGDDGHYYFALRARDPYGETGTLYVPADERDGELAYLDARGKRHWSIIRRDDLADPGSAVGRFVKFRAFGHALTFEARYGGQTVYIPVPGRWYRDEDDHYGRYVFTVRAAEGEPDSRYLKNYKLDMFLRGQTYHYKTHKEITGGTGSGALGALAGLALLGGWLVTATMILGIIMWITSNKINQAISSDGGYLALFGIISAITVGVTIWAAYSAHQEKSPYYINHVPDVTSPMKNTARRGSESPPQRRDDEPPSYLG